MGGGASTIVLKYNKILNKLCGRFVKSAFSTPGTFIYGIETLTLAWCMELLV